jgi:hypothetical protein
LLRSKDRFDPQIEVVLRGISKGMVPEKRAALGRYLPGEYRKNICGTTGRIFKPLPLVLKSDFLDFALSDEELLNTIEERIRAAGGTVTRAPRT